MEMQSSPLSDLEPDDPREPAEGTRPIYRTAKELPYELREHCLIYFEEELYPQALTLLCNLLNAGTSSIQTPALAPSTHHLALAATLAIHPSFTTRASSKERLQASVLALKLLRTVNKVIGPVNASLTSAFAFAPTGSNRRDTSRRRRLEENGESPEQGDNDAINSEIATSGSLWTRAEDFWHVLGWALNCSVAHPPRWTRWKVWLEAMLDVLEDDWAERQRLAGSTKGVTEGTDSDTGNARDDDVREPVLKDSLIVSYLPSEHSRGGYRRVVRAIFADGSASSLKEFKEVFPNETRSGSKKAASALKRKRGVSVNIEEDVYGDYLDQDSLDETDQPSSDQIASSSPPTGPTTSTDTAAPSASIATDHLLGDVASLALRQRLLALLSSVAYTLPHLTLPTPSLYDLLLPPLRALPLPSFSLLLDPSPAFLPAFPLEAHLSLSQTLLLSFLSPSAPPSPFAQGHDTLNQAVMQESYLPYPANTSGVADNCKVSILLEGLLRLLEREVGLLIWEGEEEGLAQAVEAGIIAREARVGKSRYKKGTGRDREWEVGGRWLKASGARLRVLVQMTVAAKRSLEESEEVEED